MSNLRKMFIVMLVLALLPITALGYMAVFGVTVRPEQMGAAMMVFLILGIPGIIGTVEA